MQKQRSTVHTAQLLGLALADPHSMGVHKALNEVYPALATKLFEGNMLMQKMVMSGFNMMNILDYPICGKCESLALYNGYATESGKPHVRCTCIRQGCGASTIRPVTLRRWLFDELRKKMPKEEIEDLDFKFDVIAQRMLDVHKKNMARIWAERQAEANKQMLVEQPLETGTKEHVPYVKHNTTIKVPKNAVIIPDDEEEDSDDV